jgi:hypothetical protein
MVLVLSRGGFCSKDRRQHEGLGEFFREIEVRYCRLVTVSTDNLLETGEFRSARRHAPAIAERRAPCSARLRAASPGPRRSPRAALPMASPPA